MMRYRFGLGIVLATVLASFVYAQPFTYQGFLKDNGVPANGSYDFQFRLYDAPTGDQPPNPPTIYTTRDVQNGLFTVTLDFGTAVWNGADRYLDIAVRRTGSGPVFYGLQPRVKITPTPYAVYSTNTRGLNVDNDLNVGLTSVNRFIGLAPWDSFSYDGKTMGHYALGWFADSWNFYGHTAWLSAWSGIKLFTSGTPRLAITQSGDVGIGTDNPVHRLHVAGGHAFFAENVGINTASPAQRLHVAGTGCFDGYLGVGTTDPWVRLSLGGTNANTKLALWQGPNPGDLMGFGIGPDQFRLHLHHPGNRFSFLNAPAGNELVTIEGDGDVFVRGNLLTVSGGGDPSNWRVKLQGWATGDIEYVGIIETRGVNGSRNVHLSHSAGSADHGAMSVHNGSGFWKAGLYVASSDGTGIVWGDVKSFRVPDPDDPARDIWYACIEGPEAAMYARGTAQLVNGRARIELPDHFRKLADEQDMTVQLTPRSGESKGLAAVRVSLDGIEVVELLNGRGNYAFDWEVKAVRKEHRDFQVYRPWDEVLPGGIDPVEAWEARLKSIQARQERQARQQAQNAKR